LPPRRTPPKSPVKRIRRRSPLAIVVLVVALAAVILTSPLWRGRPAAFPPGEYRVVRVVDGDTILLEGKRYVRLIGVDTPETKHPDRPTEFYGPEAAAFTHRRVSGKNVRVTFDRERTDRHGRFLAYVYIDGKLLNEELIRGGYGRASLRFPYSDTMKERFRTAEAAATQARLGIWSR